MYPCPSCRALTVGYFRKWLSYPTLPAYCNACSRYSYAQRQSGGLGVVVAAIVITACGFAAVAVGSAWPLLLGLLSAALFYLWHWHRVPLEPLSPEQVAAARLAEGLSFAALLLLLLSR
jgi:hypothetical protein